jgi:hypothetical protein
MKDSEACRISGAQFLSNYKSRGSERFVPFDVGGVAAGSPYVQLFLGLNRPSFPNASIGNPAEISKSLSAPNKQPLTLLKPTPIDGKLEWLEPYLPPEAKKVIERHCCPK